VTLAVPLGATQVCAGPQSCDGGQPPQVPPQPLSPQVFPVQSVWQLVVAPSVELLESAGGRESETKLESAAAPESPPEPPSGDLGPPPVDESTDGSPDSGVTEASWPPPSREPWPLCELSELLQAAANTETTHEALRMERPFMTRLQRPHDVRQQATTP